MSEPKVFIYETFRCDLDSGQEILIQIFRDSDTHKTIRAQIAFRTMSGDSWGIPTELTYA
jgi:alanyl-tRNA synthetase